MGIVTPQIYIMNVFRSFLKIILDLLEIAFIGIAVFILVYAFIGQPMQVTGDSMYPTLHDGDQIIAEKVSTHVTSLKRGDVVIFKSPVDNVTPIIKRVIGLPGDVIYLKNNKVYVNDSALDEPYVYGMTFSDQLSSLSPYIVDGNSYFVMGDNRENSRDSRVWGAISNNSILGKGFVIFFPFNRIRLVDTIYSMEHLTKVFTNVIGEIKLTIGDFAYF